MLLLAVGKLRQGPERALFDTYALRIRGLETVEVEERRKLPVSERRLREGERLLAALPSAARLIALDEAGKNIGSEALAEVLGQWRDDGTSVVAFAIGGADGLDEAVLNRADMRLAFGRMTWPHMMVRAMLAEQIYRTQQILAGHPYHRG